MREIKFRAWDPVDNRMLPVENINFREKYISLNEGDNSITDTFEMFNLMQYTGLKDRNGVEIYESDIVKTCEGRLKQVIWQGNGFKFLYKFNIRGYNEKTILDLGDTSNKRWGIKVIGNVYENPELLEVEYEQ